MLAVLSAPAAWVVHDVDRAGAVAAPIPAAPAPVAIALAPVSTPTSTTTTIPPSVPAASPPDTEALAATFAAAGFELPDGAAVYVARVGEAGGRLTSKEAQAGGGADESDFWPASSIKVLAAAGALAYLHTLGFTGDSTVSAATGWTSSVRDLYTDAIRDSSNEAYDHLVQIAGLDWLNDEFLTPENGFPVTVIQRSYSGEGVQSPDMTITEGDGSLDIPARDSDTDFGVPDSGNRSDLAEMVDSVRRVTLDAQLPAADRLGLAQDDLDAMTQALLDSDGFFEPGVAEALGDGALVYNKPGWAPDEACVDVGLVVDPATGSRWLLGAETPDDGGACTALADIAALALTAV